MKVRAYISIGSNIDPEENMKKALLELSRKTRLTGLSTVYKTEPEGRSGQRYFLNSVAEIETSLPPEEVKFQILRVIEDDLGRVRTEDKYADRTIDMDLILYGDMAIEKEGLKIPDPEILRRPFLAIPLFELRPGLKLPSGEGIKDAAANLPGERMSPLPEYTEELKALAIK
ncbi:MAG: 2-amino-4-hydroxy-6-hydroxymethyldihydropteridine diphosphokinase [Deltaproteobacteria bacterium]|nr:2-amino-4-hydroxy-6-hydroxymethyldihydropteridine diphosphokinase [Deltaproteobacteria bacterium]